MEGYKETEIGFIPVEWELSILGNLCNLFNGFAFKSKDYVKNSNTLNIRMSNIRPDGFFDPEYGQKFLPDEYAMRYSRYLLEEGDFIIAMTDMANDPKILGIPTIVMNKLNRNFLLNQRVGKLVNFDLEKLIPLYLKYYLMQADIRNYYKRSAKKGVQVNIGKEDVLSVKIALPSITEQKSICYVLSLIQSLVQKQNQIIQTLQDLKKTLMQKLFTGGLKSEPLKDTEIGKIPESWKIVELKKLLDDKLKNGAFIKKPIWGKGFLYANVVDMYDELCLDLKSLDRIDISEEVIKNFFLEEGDVLFVRSSLKREGVAQCCIVRNLNEKVFYDCHLIRAKFNQNIVLPDYVGNYFRSPIGKQQLVQRSKTTTMTTINQDNLNEALLPLPNIEEQNEINFSLATIDTKVMAVKSKNKILRQLFSAMLNLLMTGKIRVKDLKI